MTPTEIATSNGDTPDKPMMTADGKHMVSDGLLWHRWESMEDPWAAKYSNPTLRICGWKNAYWYIPETA